MRACGHEDTRTRGGEGDTRTRGPGAGRGGALAPEATMMMGVCSEQSTFEKHTLSQRLRLPSAILPVSPPTHAPQLSMTACGEYIVFGSVLGSWVNHTGRVQDEGKVAKAPNASPRS